MAELCEVSMQTHTSCCDQHAPGRPPITNAPGQSALGYRLETFATLREAMLDAARTCLPRWTQRSQRDYGLVLLEMWATLEDILTFYQERIANEAFLHTTVLRESTARLAALVDYRLNPGAAAQAYLRFDVDPGKHVQLGRRFRVQTRPAPGGAPVVFESDDDLEADASLNVMRPRRFQPQILTPAASEVVLQGTSTNLSVGDAILIVGDQRRANAASDAWELRRVTDVRQDRSSNTTRVAWSEPVGQSTPSGQPPRAPRLFALPVVAWTFGSDAPDYNSLVFRTTTSTGTGSATTIETRPSQADWTGKKLPEDATHPEQIFLDRTYPALLPGSWIVLLSGEPVTVDEGGGRTRSYPHGIAEVYCVQRVDETVRANYTLNAKVTRLTVDTVPANGQRPKNIGAFPVKGTQVLGRSMELPPLADVPVTTPLSGAIVELEASYAALTPGRHLLVVGNDAATGRARREAVRVRTVNGTQITLEKSLQYRYDPTSVSIYGNAVPASQGETVSNEILGSGDAARLFQQFSLKKGPLTFVRASGRDATRWGTRAELEIRVDGVRWSERESLLGSAPSERVYTVDIGPESDSTVTFGAGVAGMDVGGDPDRQVPGGARLPSGRDNVRASYRKGLGESGNVAAGAISTLVSSAPGLKSVSNPLPGTGGADRESIEQVKANVPGVMRAFDRAVSLEDYAALARTYAGVAKARAFWESRDQSDPTGRRRLEQARVLLTVATTDRNPLLPAFKQALRDFLNERRDPNQLLRIADFNPVTVDVHVLVEPDPAFLAEAVRADVTAALTGGGGLFAFQRLDFGSSVHLSDVYAAVESVPSVRAALVKQFRHRHRPAEVGTVIPALETHIFIRNTEVVRCDNDPAYPERGVLVVDIGEVVRRAD